MIIGHFSSRGRCVACWRLRVALEPFCWKPGVAPCLTTPPHITSFPTIPAPSEFSMSYVSPAPDLKHIHIGRVGISSTVWFLFGSYSSPDPQHCEVRWHRSIFKKDSISFQLQLTCIQSPVHSKEWLCLVSCDCSRWSGSLSRRKYRSKNTVPQIKPRHP